VEETLPLLIYDWLASLKYLIVVSLIRHLFNHIIFFNLKSSILTFDFILKGPRVKTMKKDVKY